ncbi:MAG: hypothetical protein HY077_11620 [Elusimicrobia bacterium]|nr:hypothetical protein [Elusimicrobiota bacterium]
MLVSSIALPGAAGNANFGLSFDASTNVWVSGGASVGGPTGLGVWEVDPTGAFLLGSATFFSASGGTVFAGAPAADSSGNAWVPASEQTSAGFTFQYDLFEFGPGAVFASSSVYRRGADLDGGFSARIDAAGSIWVAGVSSDPVAGTLDLALWKHDASGSLLPGFPVFWSGAYKSVDMLDVALAINFVSGQAWIATRKEFASCANPEFALLRYGASGVQISSSLWHNAAESGAQGRAIAVDGAGNVYAVGQSSSSMALWKYDSGGGLAAGYPQTGNYNSNALTLSGSGQPVVLNGDQPSLFSSNGTLSGASGLSTCAIPAVSTGTGYISGAITKPDGLSGGETVNVAVSSRTFLGQEEPLFFPFTASAGTTLSYSVPLPAPSTWSVAAVQGAPQSLAPGSYIGGYADYAAVAVVANSTTSGTDFSIFSDTTPPFSSITSLVSGSTLTALSSITGTASDDAGVAAILLAAHDLDADLWWDPGAQQWLTSAVPVFQSASPVETGKPDALSWRQDVSTHPTNGDSNYGGFAGNLAPGRTYKVFSQARDFVRNLESAPTGLTFFWNGPGGSPPAPPQNVNGFALGTSSISWVWNPSTGAASYNLYSGTTTLLASTTSNFYTGTNLSTNTAYQLCVSAVNSNGQSAKSCASLVFTYAAVPGRPEFTAVSSMTISVIWDARGNPAATSYQVFYSSTNFASNFFVENTTHTASSLTTIFGSRTPVEVEVQAYNDNGFPSDFSPAASTTTPFTPPQPPRNIAGAAVGVSSISWTWDPSQDADGYDVYGTTGDTREIAEQRRINSLGGLKNLANKINPIGPARQHLLVCDPNNPNK